MIDKPKGIYKVFGWISFVLLISGYFVFKTLHWPGSGPLIVTGSLFFAFFYLPLWFWESKKQSKNYLEEVFLLFSLELFIFTALFATMRWPWTGLFRALFLLELQFALFPYTIWKLIVFGKESFYKFHFLIILSIICAYTTFFILNVRSNTLSMGVFTTTFEQSEKSLKNVKNKNEKLYEVFSISKSQDSTLLNKVKKVHELSNRCFEYTKKLRTLVVAGAENISYEAADTLAFAKMNNKVERDLTSRKFCGTDEFNLSTETYSGLTLQKNIENFRDSIILLASEQNRSFVKMGINLQTDDETNEHGDKETWVVRHICNMPAAYIVSFLTGLMTEIKNAESLVLTDLLTNLNSDNNIGVELANLGIKFENEKRENQIALMKKDKEMNALLLNEQKQELSSQSSTIAIIAFALFACLALIFFAIRSNVMRKKANKELAEQKLLIEEKQKEIIDSINYAKRIQYTLLANADLMNANLPEHFVLFHPKDIVSGDFYWATKKENRFYLAVCDSTGHGVPGAFMSLLNISFLNEAITEKNILEPHNILNYVRERLISSVSQGGAQDGMDGILLCFENKNITYAAAHNAPIIIRNNEIISLEADKMPIGKGERSGDFVLRKVEYLPGDVLFLYTDGYADQFGGSKGKKFKYKPLNELLAKSGMQSSNEQREMLLNHFLAWKGDLEQVDDVLLVGIKLT